MYFFLQLKQKMFVSFASNLIYKLFGTSLKPRGLHVSYPGFPVCCDARTGEDWTWDASSLLCK